MNGKIDKFTAARIRRFTATGMAVQKGLPFDRPRFTARPLMATATLRVSPVRTYRQAVRA
jgi:hypothetical protein